MKLSLFFLSAALWAFGANAQSKIDSFRMAQDVKITIDQPLKMKKQPTILILYALPNGNTTEQTMGKKIQPTDDWHYDIQHIKAQTNFLRKKLTRQNVVVAYLENNYRSWPLWKRQHSHYRQTIPHIVDTIFHLFDVPAKTLYLNGHSGGGSFIFGYLESVSAIPAAIGRISFLDSNYGYDSSYYPKLQRWLQANQTARLTVFAYNDSVALYQGKPVVSEKGGTWYRSHLMMEHLGKDFGLENTRNDSLIFFESRDKKLAFFLKQNPGRAIFHTQQVERNGFIHSILYGTKKENEGYEYFDKRAYSAFIE